MEDFDREDDNAGNNNNTNNNNPNQELDEFQDLLHIGQGIKKRLLIKSILFENFKSYAGQVSMGPFHKRFTAVVGPNGNGKSNLIDGLLFVFGFRADKLRLKKASELLVNKEELKLSEFLKSNDLELSTHSQINLKNYETFDVNQDDLLFSEDRKIIFVRSLDDNLGGYFTSVKNGNEWVTTKLEKDTEFEYTVDGVTEKTTLNTVLDNSFNKCVNFLLFKE